jgi:signal transduction histidine kinase
MELADITYLSGWASNQGQVPQRVVDTVNHELRTPLTLIVGNAEVLQDLLLDLPEEARSAVGAIVRAGERLAALARTVTLMCEPEVVHEGRLSARTDA